MSQFRKKLIYFFENTCSDFFQSEGRGEKNKKPNIFHAKAKLFKLTKYGRTVKLGFLQTLRDLENVFITALTTGKLMQQTNHLGTKYGD